MFENKNSNNVESIENPHFFQKIHQSEILFYIFKYLSISNAQILLYINKRFRNLLLKNEQQYLREIGYLTYGHNKIIPFPSIDPKNMTISSSYISFKSNIVPITLMCFAENLDCAIISPGTFENGIFFWNIKTGVYIDSIMYKDEQGKDAFVYNMLYIENNESLIVGYSNGNLVSFNIQNFSFEINWDEKIGLKKPISKITYNQISNTIYALEVNEDISINFIKEINPTNGRILKSSVIKNCLVINMKIFEMKHILTREEEIKVIQNIINNKEKENNKITSNLPIEDYLVLSLYESRPGEKIEIFNYSIKDTKLSIKTVSEIEGDFAEIIPEVNLYGHTSMIKNFVYNNHHNYIISVGVDLYIIFWDLVKKNAKFIFDSCHEDIIYSITIINEDLFCTCGKDRAIFIWSIEEILTTKKKKIYQDKIQKNQSDIYEIHYSKKNNCIIAGSFDKTLQIHKLNKKQNKVVSSIKISGHTSTITSAKFDFVKMRLITASLDNSLIFWDLKRMSIIKSIDFKQKQFFDDFILLFDDYDSILKIDNTKKVQFFNPGKEEFYYSIIETSPVRAILNSYDGVSFLLGLSNGDISVYSYFFDNKRNKYIKSKTLYHNKIEDKETKNLRIKLLSYLNISHKYIASGASDGSICVFCLKNNFKCYLKAQNSNGAIGNIIGLKFDNQEKIMAFTIKDTLYLFDIIKSEFRFEINLGNMMYIEKLNDNYILISYETNLDEAFPGIFLFDVYSKKTESKLNVSSRNNKLIYYMKDGKNILIINGSNKEGLGMDIVSINIENIKQ